MSQMDLATALELIEKLTKENKYLREQLIAMDADNMKLEDECEMYTEIYHENEFLKKRVNDLESSNDVINTELKRIKQKYEINSLDSFMNLYGMIIERADIKVIQNKYFEMTGIKYTLKQLRLELEQLGYLVKWIGNRNTHYVSKNVEGLLYIVQLNKHEGTNIYKVGRTINMKSRLNTYKRYDGGATEIVSKQVSNQFKAEAKLLQVLNEASSKNELKRNDYGNEYYEGSLDVIKKYYNEVTTEYIKH